MGVLQYAFAIVAACLEAILRDGLWWLAAILVGLAWIKTGRSPFLWLIVLLLHLEAIRAQAWETAGAAVEHFRVNYHRRHGAVRSEVAAAAQEPASSSPVHA